MNKNTTHIYSLSSPLDDIPKYIGKANNIQKRLKEHIFESSNSKKNNWIRSLKNKNLIPNIEIIDIVPEIEWKFWEQYYISLYKSWGFDLKNGNDGGQGSHNPSLEVRYKNGSGKRGKTYEQIYGIEKANKLKENISLKNKKRKTKESTKEKISLNNAKHWKFNTYPKDKLKPMHDSNKKNVCQYDMQNNFIKEYSSATEASNETKIDRSSIIKVCKNKRKKAGEFIWKYK